MQVEQEYYLYRLTNFLITQERYELAHFNPKRNEVWLLKSKWNSTQVIRLIQRGFDWSNHLKNDMTSLFQQVHRLRKRLGKKHVQIYNVYISDLEPIDDWKKLKEPLQLKERNPLKMKMFYISDQDSETEAQRFLKEIHATSNYPMLDSPINKEEIVKEQKYQLTRSIYEKNQQIKEVFSYGKPKLSYLLIYINLIIFFLLEINGGSTNVENLIQFGAKYNPAILAGEWWRIVSSMFLHIGILHLVMNMIALYYLGTLVERIFGSFRFLYIYMLAGIAGGLTSFAFNIHLAVGASGAIFGLFGALLFFGTVYRDLFRQTMGSSLILILLINIALGLFIPQIDMGAHLGGLIGGYLAASIVYLPQKRKTVLQFSALILYFLSILLLAYLGIQNNLLMIEPVYYD